MDICNDVCWYHFGTWKLRFPSGINVRFVYRPALEWAIHNSLSEKVEFLTRYQVKELSYDQKKEIITGVKAEDLENKQDKEIFADLVVDTSGRASHMAKWLVELGYKEPQQSTVYVYPGYTSRLYKRPENDSIDWKVLAIYPKPPFSKRMGMMYPIDEKRFMVSLGGWLRDYPESSEKGFLEFAKSLPQPDFYQYLKNLTPISDFKTYKIKGNVWHHYERMKRFPGRLLIMGDSYCSFNPLYGQGMSISALEALELDKILQSYNTNDLKQLPKHFHKCIAKTIKLPWQSATGEDLRFAKAEGKCTFGQRCLQWYSAQLLEIVGVDHYVLTVFSKVQHLLAKPNTLFSPGIIWRVFLWQLSNKRSKLVQKRPSR